jgi:[1-hydroxy-2-(trimethylamino)ethyl]phosphonate dioxygenase
MLQTATVARSSGAPASLVAAALLHDVGYFLHAEAEHSIREGRNIEHEALGAAWLSRHFPDDVTQPVALHVEAKRYLCAAEQGYFDCLSDASRLSLALQGGPMNVHERATFAKHPAHEAALILRRADDRGKDLAAETPPLEHFRPILANVLRTR